MLLPTGSVQNLKIVREVNGQGGAGATRPLDNRGVEYCSEVQRDVIYQNLEVCCAYLCIL